MVKNPTGLNGVVVTSNLIGDIISDEANVIPGSIGLLVTVSTSLFTVRSAPDFSVKGIVNPIGTILSVAMLLQYSLNLPDEAVRVALDGGLRTKDPGGNATTKEVGDPVVKELTKIPKAWVVRS
ncbi:hypothetical protein NM208_g15111 [Fusarium decemcellulare]|uniref:Uncharacterized protein n=1 Tax=Fusarium decemcellulare TaxID=57161 RepID=A0ACC1RI61_9HYPO|nr:hypothetical protein NM208_g15111 [Fusarium decemcellulare]